jgi:hypothetical protein
MQFDIHDIKIFRHFYMFRHIFISIYIYNFAFVLESTHQNLNLQKVIDYNSNTNSMYHFAAGFKVECG